MAKELFEIGLALVVLGFAGAFIGMLLMLFRAIAKGPGSLKGGGAIIVGPIPIVFGTDRASLALVLVLAIALTLLLLLTAALPNLRWFG